MAVAVETLTPEAQAAAARSSPEVQSYLERKAAGRAGGPQRATTPARTPARAPASSGATKPAARSQGGGRQFDARRAAAVGRTAARATGAAQTARATRPAMRLVVAAVAGILTLELISQLTGNYFKWDLRGAPLRAKGALDYLNSYPGQEQDLAKLQKGYQPPGPPPVLRHGLQQQALQDPFAGGLLA